MTIRYLKSMDEILREFPDYEFHENGYLRFSAGRFVITSMSFSRLGKQVREGEEWSEMLLRPLTGEDHDD